jgi:glycosyltransferase involved in cell wall biosynthesis
MSILESLSYGVPVVASNVGGVAELLNGKNGLIAENNLEDWSAKINQALNDACLEDMSKEARKSYEQHFTIEKMVSAYDEIYNQMINRK